MSEALDEFVKVVNTETVCDGLSEIEKEKLNDQ